MNQQKVIALAEERIALLESIIALVEESIKDVENLQYEIEYKRVFQLGDKKEVRYQALSNTASKYLLNELINSIQPIKKSLNDIGFKSLKEYPEFELVKNKELEEIEYKLNNIEKNKCFDVRYLEEIKKLEKEIDNIESFKYYICDYKGMCTIYKKPKYSFLRFLKIKNKVTFLSGVISLDENLRKFYEVLSILDTSLLFSIKNEIRVYESKKIDYSSM